MLQEFKASELTVKIFADRKQMGAQAAADAAITLRRLLSQQETVNVIFAAAPSQNELLEALQTEKDIEWNRINAFHMDEYIGLSPDAPQRFGNFLKTAIFDKLNFRTVNYINGDTSAVAKYADLLKIHQPDLVFMGIGENGHLAFNDPPVADFNDQELVKTVTLDEACRQQQVNDGCFPSLDEVPTHAITLTIPILLQAPYIYCVVPGQRKATAVYNTLTQPVETRYPSTILRSHSGALLYLDADSSNQIDIKKEGLCDY